VPSLLLNAVLPWVAYQVLTRQGADVLPALVVTAVFPAIGVALGWARARRLDVLGALSLLLIGISLAVAFATENPLFVLVRGSAANVVFGLLCFGSLVAGRPLMFYVARQFTAGWDPDAAAQFEAYRNDPGARRAFRRITLVWGAWLFLQAGARVAAALLLETGTFLAVWPVVSTGGTFAVVYWSMAQGRRLGDGNAEAALDDAGRGAMERARGEARRYGHPYVGTEHVLLAVVGDPASTGARLVAEQGVSPEGVRDALERVMPTGRPDAPAETRLAPRMRAALRHAATAADPGPVGVDDLLVGLVAMEDGLAARTLTQLGVDLVRLRAGLPRRDRLAD
jgi:hypothetical protein